MTVFLIDRRHLLLAFLRTVTASRSEPAARGLFCRIRHQALDGVQPLVRRDWSFTGNLWVAGVGGLAIVLIIAVIMPVSCLWDKIIGLQITVWVFYVVTLIGVFIPSVLPVSMIAKVMGVVDAVVSHRFWLSAMLVAVSAAAYAVSYAIAVRVYKAKEW